jgi:hypothetical protein
MATDLTAYCARAYAEAKGNRYEAARLLAEWAHKDTELLDALLADRLVNRCWELIRTYEGYRKRVSTAAQERAASLDWQPVASVGLRLAASATGTPTAEETRVPETHGQYRERVGGKTAEAVIAMGNVTLLYRELPNGRRMADATGDDLATAIQHHRTLQHENARSVRYYTAVWTRVGNKRVGDEVTEDELRDLWQAAAEER